METQLIRRGTGTGTNKIENMCVGKQIMKSVEMCVWGGEARGAVRLLSWRRKWKDLVHKDSLCVCVCV